LVVGTRDEHHAAVDDRRSLMDTCFGGREHPHRTQPRDVGGRDLREWTESPAVVGAADHQPVSVFRTPQPFRSNGAIIAQDWRHWRRDGRGTALRGHCRERGADDECREYKSGPWSYLRTKDLGP